MAEDRCPIKNPSNFKINLSCIQNKSIAKHKYKYIKNIIPFYKCSHGVGHPASSPPACFMDATFMAHVHKTKYSGFISKSDYVHMTLTITRLHTKEQVSNEPNK